MPKDIVRHFVVTIDNLPRKKAAVQLWPVKPVGGELAVAPGGEPTLSPDNAARYEPFIKIVKNADAAQVASVYKHFYPLFQQAYVDLGYPDGYFNDRLVEVIDHLLATPEVAGPIKLTQPGVFYQYADPSIEERSAGQKAMIRLGSQNAAIVKEKLRALRKEVVKQSAEKAVVVRATEGFGEVPSCTRSHWCSPSPRSAREPSRCIWFASCTRNVRTRKRCRLA